MSQKTNPISLRLQKSNKHFESCWYSDFFYDQVLNDEVELRTYIQSIFFQAARSKTLPSIQSQYKRYCTFLFFLDQRAERHKREFSLKLSRDPLEAMLPPRIKSLAGKSLVSFTTLDSLLSNQAQDILCKERFSYRDKYSFLVKEGTRQEKSGFSHNLIQEYVYNHAIKGSYLKKLPLSLLDPVKSSNIETAHLCRDIINKDLTRHLNSESNDTLQIMTRLTDVTTLTTAEQSSARSSAALTLTRLSTPRSRVIASGNHITGSQFTPQNNKLSNSSISLKGFLAFSVISFALTRGVLHEQEKKTVRVPALVGFTEESFDDIKRKLLFQVDYKSKTENTVFFKSRVKKEPTRNIFSIQDRGLHSVAVQDNLFRRLVFDRYSQSAQNRLSFLLVRELDKQLARTKKLSILGNKSFLRLGLSTPVNLIEKTTFENNATYLVKQQWRDKGESRSRHTELLINLYSDNFGYHTLYPIRAISPYQSAGFLIESVSYLLQRKNSFRQIKDELFRELDQYQQIKGARLSCAGRLGGRSKKAQKAKTQSAQWGETSLTVFSSRLAFASLGVNTTYGKVGVKLWLCYKT